MLFALLRAAFLTTVPYWGKILGRRARQIAYWALLGYSASLFAPLLHGLQHPGEAEAHCEECLADLQAGPSFVAACNGDCADPTHHHHRHHHVPDCVSCKNVGACHHFALVSVPGVLSFDPDRSFAAVMVERLCSFYLSAQPVRGPPRASFV